MDKLLGRTANAAQLGMLLLAIFGYFYTVRPAFQNQLLQENASRLELEKNATEKQLVVLKAERSNVEKSLTAARAEVATHTAAAQGFARQAQVAKSSTVVALKQRDEQLAALRAAQKKYAFEQFKMRHSSEYLRRGAQEILADDSDFLSSMERGWPMPYETLMAALAKARSAKENADVPVQHWLDLESRVEHLKNITICVKPDFVQLRVSYLEAEKQMLEKTRAEQAAWRAGADAKIAQLGRQFVLDPKSISQNERVLLASNRISFEHKFREDIRKAKHECSNLGFKVLDSLNYAAPSTSVVGEKM